MASTMRCRSENCSLAALVTASILRRRKDELVSEKAAKGPANETANCETVKLWLQVIDSEGSTVSQFHSFTKQVGGWVRKAWGGGVRSMGYRPCTYLTD